MFSGFNIFEDQNIIPPIKEVFHGVACVGAVFPRWVGAIEKSMLISSIEEILQ